MEFYDKENIKKRSPHQQYPDILDLIQACRIKIDSFSTEKINLNSQEGLAYIEDICTLLEQNQAYTSFQIRKKKNI